jgi:cell wall-associated NlpC family hydrolase
MLANISFTITKHAMKYHYQTLAFVALCLLLGSCQQKVLTRADKTNPVRGKEQPHAATPSSLSNEQAFELLLTTIGDAKTKKELMAFEKRGMFLPVKARGVDPEQVIREAEKYMGTPHRMGGTTKAGIDCSGLLQVSFGKYGINLPHSAHEIARHGTLVPLKDDLQRGDLVFFIRTYKTPNFVTHAGIYLGNGRFIHASSSRGVMVSNIHEPAYWKPRYIFAKRFF